MRIALVGNQNSGKTTLFNLLTESNQKVGNWPGVTIEKHSGIIKNTKHTLIDLPGIYSLSPYSKEEDITVNYLTSNKLDLIINVVDANVLERSLYLTTQLLELDCKVIIALSMTDLLHKAGISIDIKQLEEMLGVKVIDISSIKKELINEFINSISNNLKKETKSFNDQYNCDSELLAYKRYKYIESITKKVIKGKYNEKKNYLDKILLHRLLAIPIFLGIMMFIYYFSIGIIGSYSNNFLKELINNFNSKIYLLLNYLNVSDWLISLISNGIINGVGSVLNFLPQLTILFLLMEILDQTGYMARVSFILDKFFSKLGLSGKSLIPFIMGTGCSVPGIMATRIIEDDIKREKTILLTPFIPCSAKLPIIIMISNYFFSSNKYFPALMYLVSVLIVILSAFILNKIFQITEEYSYIMELPKYKLPNLFHLKKELIEKINSFIKRAGSIILISSIIIWILLSFSVNLEYNVSIENSILSLIGHKISFLFYPFIGTDNWAVAVSIIQGIIAKEQVVSSMTIISGMQNNIFSSETLSFFNPISALSFLTFNLFCTPCFSTISVMKKELGSIKKLIFALLFQILIAFFVSTLIYQIGIRLW